ncbi:FIG003620: Proteophosphoglycan precursor (Fragment) [invertebrate metagenome]|uniref:FIG003620: Proteophosphoglycan n=1 Tax=invertebrate metagenome TaxID=1711999 RepID=A0A484H4P3_9ZZZZ
MTSRKRQERQSVARFNFSTGSQPDSGHHSFHIRIDRHGIWHYRGSPINRQELVCLFASLLTRQADGSYWLVTPGEAGWIDVEDVPFIAVEMFVAGHGRKQCVSLRTNVDEIITVDRLHPLRMTAGSASGEAVPYVTVRNGLEARLSRAVFYELVAVGVEEKREAGSLFGIWSSEAFFPLGRLDSTIS